LTGLGNESTDLNMHPVCSSRVISCPYKGLCEVFCWDNVGTVTGVVMFPQDPDTSATVGLPSKDVPYAHLSHNYQTPFTFWLVLLM